jgi:hypothetical protein
MNDMAGKAVRATVERIGKVPRYNITAGVREREDANPAALRQTEGREQNRCVSGSISREPG